MKKILLLAIAILAYPAARAQVVLQSFSFDHSTDKAYGMATDGMNNAIVAGSFSEYMHPTYNIPSVVRKFEPDGTMLWAGKILTGNYASGVKTCTDTDGNIYVTGWYTGNTMQMEGGNVIANQGGLSVFLVKYSPAGEVIWSRSYGGNEEDTPTGISCDANGDVILTGTSQSSLLFFDSFQVSSSWATCSFLARISSAGNVQWAKYVNAAIYDLGVNQAGEIALAGHLGHNSFIVGNSTSTVTSQGAVIAKLDTSGTPVWVKSSNSFWTSCSSLHIDAAGNVWAAGNYTDTPTIAGATFPYGQGNSNGFLIKFNAAGTRQWHKAFTTSFAWGSLAFSSPGFYIRDIKTDAAGNCLLAASFAHSVKVNNTTFTAPEETNAFLGKLDVNGNLIWALTGKADDANGEIVPQEVTLLPNNNCYITGAVVSSPQTQTVTFGSHISPALGSFLYELTTDRYNQIHGTVFYDTNHNGTQDSAEVNAPDILVAVQSPGYYANTRANGQYDAYVNPGGFTATIPVTPLYYTLAPGSRTGSFAGYGNTDSTAHFALQPQPGMQDLRVNMAASTVPRPGFDYPLYVSYRNAGTTTLSGTVELTLDSALSYQSSMPVADSVSAYMLRWDFTNLQPGQGADLIIYTTVAATIALGDSISQQVHILPLAGDLTPFDNSYLLSDTTRGSFDPNDKRVNHTSLTPTQVAAEEWLEYTIRFQNTGTDTAFTVRLADTLSAMLNVPTIVLLSASHPYTWNVKGSGILEWRFDNILLPDSNTNEPASHGFVKYRIKPNTNLSLGDVIENTAYIYFDFNEAIVTNTASTEIRLVASRPKSEANPLNIYPNPNTGIFTLQCSNIWASQVQAELRNVLGQTVWQQILPVENGELQQVVRTNALSKGVYYLQVKTEHGSKVQKVVLE